MRLLIQFAVTILFITSLQGCASPGVKNGNSATALESAPSPPAKESPATIRRLLAKDMEDDMAQSGFATKIMVSGQDDTVLTIESAEITHEIYLNLTTDAKNKAQLREMGFKRIVYTNGSDEWGLDLK